MKKINNYFVLDFETTGFKNPDIIEIGIIEIKSNKKVRQFSKLVKTKKTIEPRAYKKHQISKEMIEKKGIKFSKAINHMQSFLDNKPILGYNIKSYDKSILEKSKTKLKNEFIDVLYIARKYLNLKSHSQKNVAKYYDINYDKAHRAIGDCNITYKIYEKLKKEKLLKSKFKKLNNINISNYRNLNTKTFKNKNIAISGKLNRFLNKEEFFLVIKKNGGNPQLNVNKNTNILIVSNMEEETLKIKKAKKYKIKIIQEKELFKKTI